MKSQTKVSKVLVLFNAARPKFLVASAAPVIVGTAVGYAAVGTLTVAPFVLAVLAIMLIQAGSNIANDYFDHISGNDWLNKNVTPFSGGSRSIQDGLLSPTSMLLLAMVALTAGAAIGIVIVVITESLLILVLGLIGIAGGFFYTAPPLKLGYRCIGEIVIALLFGVLPVFAAYHIQTKTLDIMPLGPALIVSLLVFLIILINEFPDADADAAVNKKTLVVVLGTSGALWIYRSGLLASCLVAVAMLFYRNMFAAGLCYLFTLPLIAVALKFANATELTTPGKHRANAVTIGLHALGSLALTGGLVYSAITAS